MTMTLGTLQITALRIASKATVTPEALTAKHDTRTAEARNSIDKLTARGMLTKKGRITSLGAEALKAYAPARVR